MKGLKVGSICIVTGGVNFEKDSVVVLTNLEQDGIHYFRVIAGRYKGHKSCTHYFNVQKLDSYFRDIYSPTQQEIDMFNMLHGTELTREDL